MRSAMIMSTTESNAKMGCSGANQVTAPVAPKAINTNLLQTGHPTAKKEIKVPAAPSLEARSLPASGASTSGAGPSRR